MFVELIATIVAGIACAGLVMPLNISTGRRLPKWMMPVAAGLGMIGMTISNEYTWYARTAERHSRADPSGQRLEPAPQLTRLLVEEDGRRPRCPVVGLTPVLRVALSIAALDDDAREQGAKQRLHLGLRLRNAVANTPQFLRHVGLEPPLSQLGDLNIHAKSRSLGDLSGRAAHRRGQLGICGACTTHEDGDRAEVRARRLASSEEPLEDDSTPSAEGIVYRSWARRNECLRCIGMHPCGVGMKSMSRTLDRTVHDEGLGEELAQALVSCPADGCCNWRSGASSSHDRGSISPRAESRGRVESRRPDSTESHVRSQRPRGA